MVGRNLWTEGAITRQPSSPHSHYLTFRGIFLLPCFLHNTTPFVLKTSSPARERGNLHTAEFVALLTSLFLMVYLAFPFVLRWSTSVTNLKSVGIRLCCCPVWPGPIVQSGPYAMITVAVDCRRCPTLPSVLSVIRCLQRSSTVQFRLCLG